MAIRESLLNTITSVASSDFVRLVTTAGASSKATVANVFKSFESNLSAKSSLTTSDYIRVVGSDNVSYKQSVSAVADAVGSYNATPTLLTDCNDATDPSKIYYANGSTANRPSNAWFFIKCEACSGNMLFQTAYYMNATDVTVYQRSRNTNGTWGSWVKQPTRAEVDALTNKVQNHAVSNGGSITLTLGSTSKVLLTLIGGTTTSRGQYAISGYSSSMEYTLIGGNASAVALSASGLNLTITNNCGYTLNVCLTVYQGSVTKQ